MENLISHRFSSSSVSVSRLRQPQPRNGPGDGAGGAPSGAGAGGAPSAAGGARGEGAALFSLSGAGLGHRGSWLCPARCRGTFPCHCTATAGLARGSEGQPGSGSRPRAGRTLHHHSREGLRQDRSLQGSHRAQPGSCGPCGREKQCPGPEATSISPACKDGERLQAIKAIPMPTQLSAPILGSFHLNPFPSFCFQKHFWCQCHRQAWKNSQWSGTTQQQNTSRSRRNKSAARESECNVCWCGSVWCYPS